jgi:DNA-binding response OmpR family regulator
MESEFDEKQRVLICEDEHTTAFCIQKILEDLGYQSDIAYTAKDAKELLATKKYIFMTLDIILPDKNGLVLLEEIKNDESTKDLPIIILSASEQDYINANANIKQKIVYWLEKSFDFTKFKDTVNSIMLKKKTNKLKILHIEDDEDLLSIIDLTLGEIAEITSAKNLTIAEKILEKSVFDIIILDYKLPEGTCDKIIAHINSTNNKDAKLVLFSAYEPNKELLNKFDKIILKTTVSTEEFINCIKTLEKK